MRMLVSLGLCIAAAANGFAQPGLPGALGAGPACEAVPAPYQPCQCGAIGGCPRCNPPCGPPTSRELPPENPTPREGPPPYVPREIGSYVAPPRSGTTRGATIYRGLEFGSITLPELKLRMPSIEWPHCFRGRSSARMMIDSAVAPWESQGFVNAAAVAQQPAVQDRAAPSPKDAQDRAAAERSACEEYSRKLKQYEDELRSIEDQRRRLEDCIRQCLESNRSVPANLPRSEMGCVSPDNRGAKADAPHPAGQSLAPPHPPVDNGARRIVQPPPYPEQPAAYLTEPFRVAPARQWIGEPQAPTGRISGLRLVR